MNGKAQWWFHAATVSNFKAFKRRSFMYLRFCPCISHLKFIGISIGSRLPARIHLVRLYYMKSALHRLPSFLIHLLQFSSTAYSTTSYDASNLPSNPLLRSISKTLRRIHLNLRYTFPSKHFRSTSSTPVQHSLNVHNVYHPLH